MKKQNVKATRRASRVPAVQSAARHLITDDELAELTNCLVSTIASNTFGGFDSCGTPREALATWKAERATYIAESMANRIPLCGKRKLMQQVKAEFQSNEEAARMLERIAPIFEAA